MSAKKPNNSSSEGKSSGEKATDPGETEVNAPAKRSSSPDDQVDEAATGHGAPTANPGETSPPQAPSAGDRQKVVELASRMISAQIVAISNQQAATATYSYLRKLLIEVTETFSRSAIKGLDAGQVMTALNGALRNLQSPENWMSHRGFLDPLGSSNLDDLFTSAMHRAERMLVAPESDTRIIFAEQLFAPKERLSENKIFERFRDYGWPDLRSRDPVIALMTKVDAWFARCFEMGRTSAPVRNAEDHRRQQQKEASILLRAMRLCEKAASAEGHMSKPQYREVAEAIGTLLRARNMKSLGQLPNALFHLEHQKLMMMMFGESVPTARTNDEATGLKQGKRKSPVREYRPWAVFRYIRRYGAEQVDELGSELNEKLRARRLDLVPGRTPDIRGLIPEEFEFGPLGQEAEDYFAEQEADAEGVEDAIDFA